MLLFLDAHALHDRPASCILRRETVQVASQVFRYLPFRFLHESQRPPVTEGTAGHADGEGTCIPQGSESTWRRAEFFEALFAPPEVIEFFCGRLPHVLGNRLTLRDRGVPLVQALGSDFACMIDAHEPGRMPAFTRRQLCVRNSVRRVRPA
jgi:hypothetical protein